MNEFRLYLASQEYSSTSIDTHLKCVARFIKWLKEEGIEAVECAHNDLMAYVRSLGVRELKQSTIQSYLSSVKLYFDYLIRNDQLTVNPASRIEIKGIKRKTLYHTLDPEELLEIYNTYPLLRLEDHRNKVIAGLLLFQALRTVELSKLDLSNIHLDQGRIEVIGGKNSESRIMTLEAIQMVDFYQYINEIRPKIEALPMKRKSQIKQPTSKLFIGQGGSNSSFNNIMNQVISALVKKDSRVQSSHQIRTSVIVNWLKQFNLREVQYKAGHRYVSSTEAYLVNDMEGLIEEVNQFHPLG
ncbi:tyrosine-type recombinase/integrase [Ekhidna sp.]